MTDDYTYAELVDQCAQMAALVRDRDAEIERLKKHIADLEEAQRDAWYEAQRLSWG